MRLSCAVAAGMLLAACGAPAGQERPRGTDAAPEDAWVPCEYAGRPLPLRRTFWREVALVKGAVPEGRTAAEWARELDPWLASADPELRDDLAYTILAGWIVRGKIEDEPLRELAAKWRADLGRPGTSDEDVVARSFAALTLAAVVAWDLKHPFLGDEVPRIRAAALDYAANEHDVRGYDEHLGWVHATAHTADLLKFLARAPDLPASEQAKFLAAIDAKAALPGAAWSAGEDLRLARVALSLVKRPDFDADAFETWMLGYESAHRALWAAPPVDGDRLAEFGNRRRVLAELSALLAGDEASEPAVWARERVLRALRETG